MADEYTLYMNVHQLCGLLFLSSIKEKSVTLKGLKLNNLIVNEAGKEAGRLGWHNGFHLFVCGKQPEFKVHSRGESC